MINLTFEVNQIIEQLSSGNIVSFPTDTVYALAVDSSNDSAIEKLYALKKRDIQKRFVVFLENIDEILQVSQISLKQKIFIEKLIPGAVTFVLHANQAKDSIAIRVPDHPLASQIINKFSKPIIATSANISGKRNMNNADEIRDTFPGIYVSNSNYFQINEVTPSTIVSLLDNQIKIIRKGALDEKIIYKLWNSIL